MSPCIIILTRLGYKPCLNLTPYTGDIASRQAVMKNPTKEQQSFVPLEAGPDICYPFLDFYLGQNS
jgi:hypothetical protein